MLSYQDYISQNYVEIKKGVYNLLENTNNSKYDNMINNSSKFNVSYLEVQTYFIYRDRIFESIDISPLIIIKKKCIIVLNFDNYRTENIIQKWKSLGFCNYNFNYNFLKLKNNVQYNTKNLYKECNIIGEEIILDKIINLNSPSSMCPQLNIIFIFDDFEYTSEFDYITKNMLTLESIKHQYQLLHKTNEEERINDKEKIKKLEQENEDLKERLKRIEDKIFMPIEHKYF